MSGSLQSHDYVPGMSGMRIDLKTGELEINSGRITAGSLPTDPQLITVTAGDWSEYDLPANALERLAFIGADLEKIPTESRHSAEFTTEDISFDRDGSDYRTTMTYQRLETAEEVEARQVKAKAAGSRISLVGGVLSISHDGALRAQVVDLRKDEQPAPFIIVDGVTYINAALTKEASVEDKVAAQYTVKTQLLNGKTVGAGIHIGGTRFEFEKARYAGTLDAYFAKVIGKTPLYQSLREQIEQMSASEPGSINRRINELKEKQDDENRAVAERLDCLATKLGDMHTLIGLVKDSATTQARREVAEALLRDLESDKSGGTLSDCIRRFGGAGVPFSGYTGHIPLKR